MLFCWRLRQNLCHSLTDSRNLILHCLMHIFVPSLLLKNIFLLSFSFMLFFHICCKQIYPTKQRHLKKPDQSWSRLVKLLLLQQCFTSLNKLLICPNKHILVLPYNSGSFLPAALLLHVPGTPCLANKTNVMWDWWRHETGFPQN